MGWLKKTVKKFKKTLHRASRGKFHLNPLKNGVHAMTDPIGHSQYRLFLSHHQKHKVKHGIDFGHIKKQYKKLLGQGNNSAQSVYFYDTGYSPSGSYQYRGRTISEMM